MIPCPHFSDSVGFWVYWDSVKILSYRRYFSMEVCRLECLCSAAVVLLRLLFRLRRVCDFFLDRLRRG